MLPLAALHPPAHAGKGQPLPVMHKRCPMPVPAPPPRAAPPQFVEHHRATGTDVTIGCLPVDATRASDFGLMKIDGEGRITEFAEKPKGDALEKMRVDTTVLGAPLSWRRQGRRRWAGGSGTRAAPRPVKAGVADGGQQVQLTGGGTPASLAQPSPAWLTHAPLAPSFSSLSCVQA
jgi:hypothetical protein